MKKILVFTLTIALFIMPLSALSAEASKLTGRSLTCYTREKDIPLDAKIVSGYYISSYLILALGLNENLVGIENKPETRPFYGAFAPDTLNLPQVGTAKALNLEAVAALSPQLVILPPQQSEASTQLKALNIHSIVVNPETLDGMSQAIIDIGAASGTDDRANAIVTWMNDSFHELTTLTENLDKPTVYLSSASSPLSTLTPNMFQATIVAAAGGQLVTSDIEGNYWAVISPEQLLSYDPNWIILASASTVTIQSLKEDMQLNTLAAIKTDKLIQMPCPLDGWDNPTPAAVLGSWWLASKLHPEVVSAELVLEKAMDYYSFVFGVQVTSEILGL